MRSYLTYKLKRLTVPILAIGVALLLRLLLDPILHTRMPYGLFMIAVIVTACFADTWETLVALFLGFFLAAWFFVEPRASLFIVGKAAWLSACCYLFIGLSIVWIARNGHAAQLRELSAAVQLRKYQEELDLAKAHQRQTQAVQELMAQVIENSEEAIIAFTPTKEIIAWNAAADKLFGYSAHEALGEPLAFLFAAGNSLAESGLLDQILPAQKAQRRIMIRNHRDGSQTEALLTFSAIRDASGKIKGGSLVAGEIQVLRAS